MRITLRMSLWTAGALLWMPTSLVAQAAVATEGSTVRVAVQGDSQPRTGTLVRAEGGAWALLDGGGALRTLEREDITSVELGRSGSHWKRGALIGGAAGLAFGLVVLSTDDCEPDFRAECDALIGTVATAVLVWFPLGAAGIGALIGSMVRTTRWTPAVLPGSGTPGLMTLRWTIPIGGNER